jgi:hypothetical protein
MACTDDYLDRKERYREAVDAIRPKRPGKQGDADLRMLHLEIVGTEVGYARTLPPYCDDPACRCQKLP